MSIPKNLCITKCIINDRGRLVKAVVKKWGNSLGIVLPISVVRSKDINVNDIIEIQVTRKIEPIDSLFGTCRIKKPTQKIKDELRAGWDG